MVDVALAWSVAEKVLLVVVGVLAARFVERRPRLNVYYGHVGVFQIPSTTPGGGLLGIHTHTVVLRNAGRLPAHNVRVPHRGSLEAHNIHVSVDTGVNHTSNILPGGEEEIVFPTLVPGQQVTLSYLYFPPITWNEINLPISSDEGMAKQVNVLPTVQLPRWLRGILWGLIVVGTATLLYGLLELSRWVLAQTG